MKVHLKESVKKKEKYGTVRIMPEVPWHAHMHADEREVVTSFVVKLVNMQRRDKTRGLAARDLFPEAHMAL